MPARRRRALCLLPVNRTWAAPLRVDDTVFRRSGPAPGGRSGRKLAAVPAPPPLPAASPRAGSHRLPPAAEAVLATVLALALASAGCSSFDATFGQREAVVQFRPQTSTAVRLKVRAACSHLPRATPEPLPTDHLASDLSSDVRYRVDSASDGDLARLQKCLQKYPSVVGIDFTSPAGS
jgi:hypothetical protein